MLRLRTSVQLSIACVAALGSDLAVAQQNYPVKVIRVLAPPGGGGDLTMRLLAQKIGPALGQPMVVENRAPLAIGDAIARAEPDGYTIMQAASTMWLRPLLSPPVSFDGVKDFAPVTILNSSPSVLVVHPSVPAKTVQEFVALAKQQPGKLNFGSSGVAGVQHLPMELLKTMTGIDIVHIPYKSSGDSINDLVAGRVQAVIASVISIAPFISSGKVRALGVTTPQPYVRLPGLPTMASQGLPGYEYDNISGMMAPAKTPATVINRLNQEYIKAINDPEVKEKVLATGTDILTSTPQGFADKVKADVVLWGRLFKELKITAE